MKAKLYDRQGKLMCELELGDMRAFPHILIVERMCQRIGGRAFIDKGYFYKWDSSDAMCSEYHQCDPHWTVTDPLRL